VNDCDGTSALTTLNEPAFVESARTLAERVTNHSDSTEHRDEIALGSLLTRGADAAPDERHGGLPPLPHVTPKAKRVICLLQNGAPSQVDLFDLWNAVILEFSAGWQTRTPR